MVERLAVDLKWRAGALRNSGLGTKELLPEGGSSGKKLAKRALVYGQETHGTRSDTVA
jgi:hypothetical protein